jgi:glycosyltransferase involved in cell wall biosynthesis
MFLSVLGAGCGPLLNQTLPRKDYEVVLTKNFDSEHDDQWQKSEVKLVWFPGRKVGERVADALRYCCGDVICFLDDDDVYAPNKLSTPCIRLNMCYSR